MHMYKYMNILFEGVCLTTPGASEGGLEAAGQVALRADWRDPQDRRENSGWPLLCVGCVLESHLLGMGRPSLSENYQMSLGGPDNLHGIPRRPEVVQGQSKAKGPKRNPKSAQGEKKGVEGHTKSANKSQDYVHLNNI